MEEKQQVFEEVVKSIRRRWGIELSLADKVQLRSEIVPQVLNELKQIKEGEWEFIPSIEAEWRLISEYGIYPDAEMFVKDRKWRERVVRYAQILYDRSHLI